MKRIFKKFFTLYLRHENEASSFYDYLIDTNENSYPLKCQTVTSDSRTCDRMVRSQEFSGSILPPRNKSDQ